MVSVPEVTGVQCTCSCMVSVPEMTGLQWSCMVSVTEVTGLQCSRGDRHQMELYGKCYCDDGSPLQLYD